MKTYTQIADIVVAGAVKENTTRFVRTVHVPVNKTLERDDTRQTSPDVDFGRIPVNDDLIVHLFGLPQNLTDENRELWQAHASSGVGIILLIDAARPETFEQSRMVLQTLRDFLPVPFVIALSNPDIPGAPTADSVRDRFSLANNTGVFPFSLHHVESCQKVLLEMLYAILEEMG